MGAPLPKETSITDSTRDLTGTTVGRFSVRARLGKGGMGEVYLADDPQLKRPVALKRLIGEAGKDRDYRRRLLKEAQRASALNHQNIASVYDVFEENGELFLVMEYVEGQTLRHRLREAVDVDSFVGIAVQAVEGLVAAHEKGVVHRDLKPENIMLRDDGVLKILDFGVARRLPSSLMEGSTLSSEEADAPRYFAGTLPYMAPEILLEKDGDERSDIFSLGVVFYETLTGRHPFRSRGYAATVERILHETPQPLTRFRPHLPQDIDRIVAKMLAKNPGQRYATAADLLVDLRVLSPGRAELAPVVPAEARGWRRWMRLVLAAATAVVLVLAGYWTLTGPQPEASTLYLVVETFENLGGDPELAYYSSGVTDTIMARLAGLPGIYVIPVDEDIPGDVGLNGSIQLAGDTVRINYRLVHRKEDRSLGGNVVEGNRSEIFTLQDQVAEDIVQILRAEFDLQAEYVVGGSPTQDVTAYEFYLQGREYLRRYEDLQNVNIAIDLFQRALGRDSNYAMALAGLGEAYWQKYQHTRDAQWVDRALEACQRALELNDRLSAAHVVLGTLRKGMGEYEAASKEFLRAIELSASHKDAYTGLASVHEALGRPEEAEAAFRRAIQLHPNFWGGYNDLGRFYYTQGRYQDAAAMFRLVVELTPDNARGYSNLGGMYYVLGRVDEALEAYRRALAIRPMAQVYSNLATLEFFYRKKYSAAARAYEKATEMQPGLHIYWGNLGDAYFYSPGEREKAAGAYQGAAELIGGELQVNPRDAVALCYQAYYRARLGQVEEALADGRRAREFAPENAIVTFMVARVLNLAGQMEESLRLLREAVSQGYSTEEIQKQPEFEAMQERPAFREIFEQ